MTDFVIRAARRKGHTPPQQPRLCPRCLNILVRDGKQWRCPKGHEQPKAAA